VVLCSRDSVLAVVVELEEHGVRRRRGPSALLRWTGILKPVSVRVESRIAFDEGSALVVIAAVVA
jgi:hypothetical protein